MTINREFLLFNAAKTGLKHYTGNGYQNVTMIVGFCTAASLLFAKKCLETPTWFPHKREDAAWGDSQAQLVMHKMNKCNDDPVGLAACAGLTQTTGIKKAVTPELVALEVSQVDSRVGIFWNSYHTIGIRQAEDQLHVWDQNNGFFSMGIPDLGVYYRQYYPQAGWRGQDRLQGFLGLALV